MSRVEEGRAASPGVVERPAKGRYALGRVQAVVAAVVVALLVDLAIWAIGAAAGGSFEHTDGGVVQSAAPGGVVLMTTVPLLVGMTLAAGSSYLWPGVIRVAQVVGAALALLTTWGTLVADFDGASTAALAAMHVVIAVVVVAGLEAMRRGLAGRRTNG